MLRRSPSGDLHRSLCSRDALPPSRTLNVAARRVSELTRLNAHRPRRAPHAAGGDGQGTSDTSNSSCGRGATATASRPCYADVGSGLARGRHATTPLGWIAPRRQTAPVTVTIGDHAVITPLPRPPTLPLRPGQTPPWDAGRASHETVGDQAGDDGVDRLV